MSGRSGKPDLSQYNYGDISSLVLTTDRSALPRRDGEPDGASGSGANNCPIECIRIGSGTFATIYMNTATPEVYKKCRSAENCAILAEEYRQMKLISEALQASGNTILSPTPIDFYGPDDVEFWDDPAFVFPAGDAVRTGAYSMTRVYPLPSTLKAKLIDLFCPPNLNERAPGLVRRGHHLARLLLGRPEPDANRAAPQRFFDTYNFPLTRGRAEQLGLNTVLLSGEMGRMLAQLHMTARNDARDIEVVLGANITSPVPNRRERREPRVWVLDFNQVKEFDFTENQIPLLVDAFFANEAYFPRARPADSLYGVFSKAYLEECKKIGEVAGQLGQKFIVALEAEQVHKDANGA
ncbi:hypothetical protein BDZ97DRAFT_1790796 [Flammula alnicola]|nr:hypothetical protein BDZ97DRAFT_1790796 [Flammula alnicola]